MAENAQLALKHYRDKDQTKVLGEIEAHKDEVWKPKSEKEIQENLKPQQKNNENELDEIQTQESEEKLDDESMPKEENRNSNKNENEMSDGKSLFEDLCTDNKTKYTDVEKGKGALKEAKENTQNILKEQEMDETSQEENQDEIGIND